MEKDNVEVYEDELELDSYKKVSVGGWMGTLILSAIPVVNLVLWFIWAFSAKRASRRTFAAACLWLTLICLVLSGVGLYFFGNNLLEWARTVNPEAFKVG